MATLADLRYLVSVACSTEWAHSLHGAEKSALMLQAEIAQQGLQANVYDLQQGLHLLPIGLAVDLDMVLSQAKANGVMRMLARRNDVTQIFLMRVTPLSFAEHVQPQAPPPGSLEPLVAETDRTLESLQDMMVAAQKRSSDVLGARLVATHLFVQSVARESDGEHRPMKRARLEELATIACEAGEVFDRIADQTFNPTMPDLDRTGPDERNLPRK
jgi:hypothetical protein